MSFNVCFGRFIYYNYSQRSYRYKSVFDTLFIVSLVVYLISWSYIWSYLDHRLTLKFEWERPLLNLFFKWNLFQNSFLWGGGLIRYIRYHHITLRHVSCYVLSTFSSRYVSRCVCIFVISVSVFFYLLFILFFEIKSIPMQFKLFLLHMDFTLLKV